MDFAAEQTSISGQFMTYCYKLYFFKFQEKGKKIHSVVGHEKIAFLILSEGLRARDTHHTFYLGRAKSYM